MKKWSIELVLLFCGMCLFAQSLFDLVETGTPEQVQAAINAGTQVNDSDTLGQTPLMLAAECNENPDVITTLLNAGAKLDDRKNEYSKTTPLMYAASSNRNPDVITTLLNAGAKLDDRGKDVKTLLMYAAWFNENPAVITTLLNAGANVNDRDTFGMTPLMYAASGNENPDVITVLLNAGADAKAKSIEGKTAFDYAQDNPKIKGTRSYWDLDNARF